MNRNLRLYGGAVLFPFLLGIFLYLVRAVPSTLGLLLAVPVTASANVVLRHLLGRYRGSSFFLSPGGGEI